jgi:hypothetical protein
MLTGGLGRAEEGKDTDSVVLMCRVAPDKAGLPQREEAGGDGRQLEQGQVNLWTGQKVQD